VRQRGSFLGQTGAKLSQFGAIFGQDFMPFGLFLHGLDQVFTL